jgi:hypothetical protein
MDLLYAQQERRISYRMISTFLLEILRQSWIKSNSSDQKPTVEGSKQVVAKKNKHQVNVT